MSEGTENTQTVDAEDVTVRKTVERGPDDTATVTLDVETDRSSPATVRLAEPALASVPGADLDLHADHGAEHWRLDDEAVFEREFAPGESYTIVYRVADAGRLDAIDDEPALQVVAPEATGADGVVDREASDVVRDVVAGERDSLLEVPLDGAADEPAELSLEDEPAPAGGVSLDEPAEVADESAAEPTAAAAPDSASDSAVESDAAAESTGETPEANAGAEPDASEEEPESVDVESDVSEPVDVESDVSEPVDVESDVSEPVDVESDTDDVGPEPVDAEPDVAEPDADDAESADSPAAGPDADAGAVGAAAAPSGGVARVLVKELQQGYVDDETKAQLREALEPGRSQDVRIKHLQSEVSDFAAYVEMLEEFIDRFGTFEEVFDELDQGMAALEDELEAVRSEVDEVADVVDEVEDLSGAVSSLRDDHDDLSSEHADLSAEQANLAGEISQLDDGQEFLDGRVQSLEAELDRLEEQMDDFEQFRGRLSGVFQEFGVDGEE